MHLGGIGRLFSQSEGFLLPRGSQDELQHDQDIGVQHDPVPQLLVTSDYCVHCNLCKRTSEEREAVLHVLRCMVFPTYKHTAIFVVRSQQSSA